MTTWSAPVATPLIGVRTTLRQKRLNTRLAAFGASIKRAFRGLARRSGYDIRRYQPGRAEFLASRNIDVVIDVGANVGQFVDQLRADGYGACIESFEPLRDAFAVLEARARGDSNWKVHNIALSDKPGLAKLKVSGDSTFSSLHDITRSALAFDPAARAIREDTIELMRLDDFKSAIGGERIFLKIDAQGHEQQVLEGARGILDRVQGVQLELPISALYEGVWTISGAMQFMRELGFVPTYFYPVNFHWHRDPVAVVDVDCIFRRLNPAID